MSFTSEIEKRLEQIRAAGHYREMHVPTNAGFVDNDYLDLSRHPKIIEAAEWALRINGAGHRGSRLLGGHSRLFEELEEKLAAFFHAPAALVFSTGYLANQAAVQVLGGLVDTIVSDENNHASLIDGIRLTGKPKAIVRHNQWDDLPSGRQLLVAESLYSMDGDLVAADKLRAAMARTDSFLLLDEAHAAGVLCEDGRGVGAGWRDWSRMAVTVTFGKAFGASGAAILCSKELRELLINTGRAFIFSTAPNPAAVGAVSAALEVIEEESWRREDIWNRAETVREILREATGAPRGSLWEERTPIIPFPIPGEDNALRFCENMRKSGVELRAIRYPTVKRGAERIRISLGLAVTFENTELAAKEVVRQWKEFSSRE